MNFKFVTVFCDLVFFGGGSPQPPKRKRSRLWFLHPPQGAHTHTPRCRLQ